MKGFNLRPSNSSLRTASEFSSFKRSAKAFSFKKASLGFHKYANRTPRRSYDGVTSSSTPSSVPSTPLRASTDVPKSPRWDEVICISREGTFDSSSADEISPDELRTPSVSQYASSSSSSSYHLPTETDDQSLRQVDDEVLDECDLRRGSRLSMVSSWVGHHLQELDISYDEDEVCEIEIVTTDDGFLSRKDSLVLPPGEAHRSYRRKRNLPIAPTKQISRLSRPLPCTPATPGFGSQSRRIRPLPPAPLPS
jgi:hypothetical protein